MAHRRTSEPGANLPRKKSVDVDRATAGGANGATAVDHRQGVVDRQPHHEGPRRETPREDPHEEEWKQYIENLERDGLLPDGVMYRALVIMDRRKETDCMRVIHDFVPQDYHGKDPVRQSLLQYKHAADDLANQLQLYTSMFRGRPLEFAHTEFARTLAFALFTQNATEDMTLRVGRRLYEGPRPDPSLVRTRTPGMTIGNSALSLKEWERRHSELDTHLLPFCENRDRPNIDSWQKERPSTDRTVREVRVIINAITTLMSEGLPSTQKNRSGKITINPTFARRDFLTMIRAMASTDIGSRIMHGVEQNDVDRFAREVDPNLIQVDGMYFTEQSDQRQRALRQLDMEIIESVLQKMHENEEKWVALRTEQTDREAAERARQQQRTVQSFAADMRVLAEVSAQEASERRSMGTGWRGAVLKLLDVVGLYPRMKAARDAKREALRALQSPQYSELCGDPSTLEERAHDLLLATVATRQISAPTGGAQQESDRLHSQPPTKRRETQ